MSVNYGRPAWTDEEIKKEIEENEARRIEREKNAIIGDGNEEIVVLEDIEKEQKTSQAGNTYTLHTYHLATVDGKKKESFKDFTFAMTRAFEPVRLELGESLRLGVTVLRLKTSKIGDKTSNGKTYPVWSFSFEVEENPKEVVVPVEKAGF